MSKKNIVLIIVIIACIGIVGYIAKRALAPTTAVLPASQANTPSGSGSQTVEIDMGANSFTPATVTIHSGDTVTFVNKDTAPHWPASDPHPTHTGYPGFDALQGVPPGQSYSFQFIRTGSFGFHDHLDPSLSGTVVVEASTTTASITPTSMTTQETPLKVGSVTWHQKNFIDKNVFLVGYVLKKEKGYVIFSDEATGAITAHDLPISGTGTTTMTLRQKYTVKGTFLDKGLVASNGSKYHLELSEIPQTVL